MVKILNILILIFAISSVSCQNNNKHGNIQNKLSMKYNKLTKEETRIILHKGTERPHTGKYDNFFEKGTYNCKQCGVALYNSNTKFDGHCGWPSFDDEIEGAVKRILDADGRRTEIVCSNCGGHLGHVFIGEGFTDKDTRHCVNSVSISFNPLKDMVKTYSPKTEVAIFASGCFWGTEHWMKKQKGVISTNVGYIGGHVRNPTYEQVCTKTTGHAEAVKVVFNPEEINYETLAKIFFETHDPTQVDGQGPDIGNQYRSEIFYTNDNQKLVSEGLINFLEKKGLNVATKLTEAPKFWKAENYHQDYYEHKGTKPYCHFYTKKF